MRSDVIQIRWYSSGGCKTQNRGRPSAFGFVQSQGDHTWLELPPRSKKSTRLQGLGINHSICDLPNARLSSKTIRENCKKEQFETPSPFGCWHFSQSSLGWKFPISAVPQGEGKMLFGNPSLGENREIYPCRVRFKWRWDILGTAPCSKCDFCPFRHW